MLLALCMCVYVHVWLSVIPWTVALQTPLSMEFSRQENWNFLLQGIFLTYGSNLRLLHCQADSLPLGHLGSPACAFTWKQSRWCFVGEGGGGLFLFFPYHIYLIFLTESTLVISKYLPPTKRFKKWGLCSQIVGHLNPRALACSSRLDPVNAPA